MKNSSIAIYITGILALNSPVQAQDTVKKQEELRIEESKAKEVKNEVLNGVKESAAEIKQAGKEIGNKTAELTVKGTAAVTDQKLRDKTGPGGQTVYVDKYNNYYYVNDRGRKVYLRTDALKDKK
ncbi:MAG TPA: hypothetical protein VL098_12990 [Flavipsychrobacter sp.]|nr:hypothetical protein [Flavipsychrobacter sp.]